MDGAFPVASFFSSLQGAALVSLPYEGIWKIKALPRVLLLGSLPRVVSS